MSRVTVKILMIATLGFTGQAMAEEVPHPVLNMPQDMELQASEHVIVRVNAKTGNAEVYYTTEPPSKPSDLTNKDFTPIEETELQIAEESRGDFVKTSHYRHKKRHHFRGRHHKFHKKRRHFRGRHYYSYPYPYYYQYQGRSYYSPYLYKPYYYPYYPYAGFYYYFYFGY